MILRHEEIETLAQFDAAVASGSLARAVVQSLDLTHREPELASVRVDGALFLGCQLTQDSLAGVQARGGLVFPRIPDVPIDPYRSRLYSPINLFDRPGHYAESLDARAYAWTRLGGTNPSLAHTLASSLHDHAITEALDDYLFTVPPTQVVGVMGGHAMERGSEGYEATAALGLALSNEGMLVASGGGPGAMEAANLGARMAPHGTAALAEALSLLAAVPSFVPSIDAWVDVAFEVRDRFAGGADTLGIPTWYYGHEPPNVFASRIAKYCSNALREDILLQRCKGGLVYLPGAAGTVQEVFQAVTGNYYAGDPSSLTPMVLVGVDQWTRRLPAWPLLESLARGRTMAHEIALVDTVEEAGRWLAERWG